MPFGNDAGPTIVYRYYARAPKTNREIIEDQMLKMHQYRNSLVELERERRKRFGEIMTAFQPPEAQELEQRLKDIKEQINSIQNTISQRNANAKKKTGTPQERTQIKELCQEKKTIILQLQQIKNANKGDPNLLAKLQKITQEINYWKKQFKIQPNQSRQKILDLKTQREEVNNQLQDSSPLEKQLAESNQWFQTELKRRRSVSNLFWPNYLHIEKTVARTGPPPKFQSLRGDGRNPPWVQEGLVTVQIQGGLSMANAYACKDTRFRIQKPIEISPDARRGERERSYRTIAQVRIQSDDDGKPIWAEVPVRMDRLPPDDAWIKWVFLQREKWKGTHERWTLQLVLERDAGWASNDTAECGRVGIDLGWRLFKNRLRVAYWVGDDGREGEFALPLYLIGKWQRSDELQTARSLKYNEVKTHFLNWIQAYNTKCPEWLLKETKGLPQSKSEDRMAALVKRWKNNRFTDDSGIFSLLMEWRKQDRRLLEEKEALRQQAINERNGLFWHFARQIRGQYHTLVLEDWHIRKTIQKPGVEESTPTDDGSRIYHRMAAPGLLRLKLVAKAANVEYKEAAYTTLDCHACGGRCDFDARKNVIHSCEHCGKEWDQDQNAAKNLLGREREDNRQSPGNLSPKRTTKLVNT